MTRCPLTPTRSGRLGQAVPGGGGVGRWSVGQRAIDWWLTHQWTRLRFTPAWRSWKHSGQWCWHCHEPSHAGSSFPHKPYKKHWWDHRKSVKGKSKNEARGGKRFVTGQANQCSTPLPISNTTSPWLGKTRWIHRPGCAGRPWGRGPACALLWGWLEMDTADNSAVTPVTCHHNCCCFSSTGQHAATREWCSLLVALTLSAATPVHSTHEIFWFLVQAGNIGLLIVFHSFIFDVISNIVRYSSAMWHFFYSFLLCYFLLRLVNIFWCNV